MAKRSMYVWKLRPIVEAEGSVRLMIDKARRAKISSLWVKIANGDKAYPNVTGDIKEDMSELVDRARDQGIEVWGWHVPRCATSKIAQDEARTVSDIAASFQLDGLIMDAERGPLYFLGDTAEAETYAQAMRQVADNLNVPLAISCHDLPAGQAGWLDKFNLIAAVCDLNFPQVYYGRSPSVENRLTRAEAQNLHLPAAFAPVGAGWIDRKGEDGGCKSASACAERAREFIRLIKDRGYQEYSFWHWAGAPSALWQVLNTVAP